MMPPNDTLERTVRHSGPRLSAARPSWLAATRSLGMTKMARLRLALALFAFGAFPCCAMDSVRIAFEPAYALPGAAVEAAEIVVTRKSIGESSRKARTDAYFSAVKEAVASVEKNSNCGNIVAGFPTVSNRVEVEGQSMLLRCSFSDKGVVASINASESEARYQRALDRILKLTFDRAKVQFAQ